MALSPPPAHGAGSVWPEHAPPTDAVNAVDGLAALAFEGLPQGAVVLEPAVPRILRLNRAVISLWRGLHGRPVDSNGGHGELLEWLEQHGVLAQAEQVRTTGRPALRVRLEPASGSATLDDQPAWLYDLVPLPQSACVLLVISDVTPEARERRRAERAMFSAQLYAERLEASIEQLAEGVIIRDQRGQVRAYNRTALAYALNRAAVTQGRARGIRLEPVWDLRWLDGSPVAEMEHPAWRAMLTGRPVSGGQFYLRGEHGEQTPVTVNAAPLQDEEGTLTGAVLAFSDITALMEVERMKDEFIATASHELRQPLTVITGQLQLLDRHLEQLADPATAETSTALAAARAQVTSMEEQTERLNQRVSDLLDMSRIQAGELQLESQVEGLVHLVRNVVRQARDISPAHEIHLALRLPPGARELEAYCDAQRVEQILLNLLTNAVKYSPNGGAIQVSVDVLPGGHTSDRAGRGGMRTVAGPAARVRVQDEGIGIPADALPHLFERFYRAGNTTGIAGTGLGLYICRQLAWAHEGDLWVEHRPQQTGTTFCLVLPLLAVRLDEPAH